MKYLPHRGKMLVEKISQKFLNPVGVTYFIRIKNLSYEYDFKGLMHEKPPFRKGGRIEK